MIKEALVFVLAMSVGCQPKLPTEDADMMKPTGGSKTCWGDDSLICQRNFAEWCGPVWGCHFDEAMVDRDAWHRKPCGNGTTAYVWRRAGGWSDMEMHFDERGIFLGGRRTDTVNDLNCPLGHTVGTGKMDPACCQADECQEDKDCSFLGCRAGGVCSGKPKRCGCAHVTP